MSKQKRREDEIRRLVESVCKPVPAPPEFKKRLLECLMREAEARQIGLNHHKCMAGSARGNKSSKV